MLRAGKNLEAMNRKFAATVAVLIVFLTSGAEELRAQLLPDVVLLKSGEKVEGRITAESDLDLGPSARFNIERVLWRADSKAFALTAMLWKRGSSVSVFVRDGSSFREIKLPELAADVPEKVKGGKSFPHIAESNSQSA